MRRKGFTLIEMLLVVAVISIIVAFATPKVRSVRDGARLRAARDQVATALAIARAAAVQKGQTGEFTLSNNAVMVTLPQAGQTVLLSRDLNALYSATVRPASVVIDYDTRGFASNVGGGGTTFTVTVGDGVQTVCVSRLGLILKSGCLQ